VSQQHGRSLVVAGPRSSVKRHIAPGVVDRGDLVIPHIHDRESGPMTLRGVKQPLDAFSRRLAARPHEQARPQPVVEVQVGICALDPFEISRPIKKDG
jgi:hypothetical protein